MGIRRRAVVTALAVAAAVVVPSAVLPATAQAAAYRYWSYWLGNDGGWTFANVGPAYRSPADGTIEGWRYSVSGVTGGDRPGFAADFDAVCGQTPAEDGRKRVAVVVDPGSVEDAPEGEQPPGAWALCVVAEPKATGYDVLRAAATVRAERGLICAIGGFPARGCAEVIADPSPKPTPKPTPTATPTPKPTAKPQPTRSPSPAPQPTEPSGGSPAAPQPNGGAGQSSSSAAAPASSETTSAASETTSAASPSSPPASSATPTPSSTSPAPPADVPLASPEPSISLLTAPLEEPPSDGGGSGAVIAAGIAVAGIAGLGGAAILRMRRGTS